MRLRCRRPATHIQVGDSIEGSASWGTHAAIGLIGAGFDCREVAANIQPRVDGATVE